MNRLQHEKSPYLLQHKNNPVDWYPWGKEAFQEAKKLNKPIFLSIGYATCHWCHVMEHESFEDKEIAKLLNDTFINIKVDREERPDIDSTYMTVCQMVTGHGGWPLTIIMTPEKKPFFAGTYIPKEARFQRIGLRQLIPGIAGMWQHEPEKVIKAVQSIQDGFNKSLEFESGIFPGSEAVDYAAEQLIARYDEEHGGFGSAPKFPSPHNLGFLLRQWHLTSEERFKSAVEQTLIKMRLGGLWDHIGYGFHRYSTDKEWLLPHFEKMLYDQALLMLAYTEGWQVSQNPLFKQTVFEIANYVECELTHPDGFFYSAQDADTDGEEGKFYVWSQKEIEDLLTKEESEFFLKTFNFYKEGNFKDEATKQFTGKNIPHLASELSKTEEEKFNIIRQKLFKGRTSRTSPLLDDKTLTDWNALMIAALAKAGTVFGNQRFIDSSQKAFRFIIENCLINGQLMHRFKEAEASIHAFADDYLFLMWAALELYDATFDTGYLQEAEKLGSQVIDLFWDKEQGGFFFTTYNSEKLLGRQKQIYDGAIPSSNSVAMLNFLRLSRLTGNTKLEQYVDEIGKYFSTDFIRSGSSITHGLQAIQFLNNSPKELVIVEGDESFAKPVEIMQTTFTPFMVTLVKKSSDNKGTYPPFAQEMKPIDGKTTFYVCTNFSCEKPFTEAERLQNLLKPGKSL